MTDKAETQDSGNPAALLRMSDVDLDDAEVKRLRTAIRSSRQKGR